MPKLRRSSSSPMAGIFTRSRAEIFLHRTRSGCARPDPAGRKRHHHIQIPPTVAHARASSPDGDGGAISISIKDLRARRVFSPTSISAECFPDQIKDCDDRIDGIDGSEKESTGEQKSTEVVEVLQGSEGDPDKEWVQTTPPDIEFLRKLDGVDGRSAESVDRAVKVSGDDLHAELTSRQPESDSSIPTKNRPGIAPCSRLKLYRNPSSFGYRRLLPYLMDLAKDGLGGVEILHCRNDPIKVERNMEEKALLLNTDPSSKQKDDTVGSEDTANVLSERNLDFAGNDVSKNIVLRPSTDVEDLTVMKSSTPCDESAFQVHRVASEASESLNSEFELLCKSSYSPPIDCEALSVQELAGNGQALSCLPRKVKEGYRTLVPALESYRKPPSGASQLGILGALGNRVLAPKRGILKRHTRGCRGLCVCLDCSSFRLHAERAFEFSRKQMQEADEVVTRLMKELSYLRNMMKSIVPLDDGAGNCTFPRLNQKQVKEACQNALRVEELAKSHLGQMIHELNSHCRIPGPRVTFAASVDERSSP